MKTQSDKLLKEIIASEDLNPYLKNELIEFICMMQKLEKTIKSVKALVFETRFLTDREFIIEHPDYFISLLGYDKSEKNDFRFDDFISHLHPDDREDFNIILDSIIQRKAHFYSGAFRMRQKDTYYKWLLASISLEGRNEMNNKPVISGILIDCIENLCSHKQINEINKSLLFLKTNMDIHNLTSHEIKIARLIADGYTTLEIAVMLNLSEATVNTIKSSMSHKTSSRNAAHLVKYLFTHGLY